MVTSNETKLNERIKINLRYARSISSLNSYIDWVMKHIYPSLTEEEKKVSDLVFLKYKNVLEVKKVTETKELYDSTLIELRRKSKDHE